MQKWGVVWEVNSSQGWRSAIVSQRAGADRTTTVIHVYCSTRCLRAIQTQPGAREEMGSPGAWGARQNSEDPGQRESRICGLTALLGGPTPVCIMTPCRAHCYFSQHGPASARWPAGWPLIKGKKQALDLFLLQKCSLSFYSVLPCFPWLPWYFPFVYMTLPLVTSFKCVFTKRKVRLANNPQSQFFLPKSVPQSCPTIWSYFYLCKCGKRGDISKVNVTRPGSFAWVVRLR